ncbi:MAG: hypothetical protein IBX46_07330 [Desulfuromonadales bacterium]|nr:hypothetical protein [Desulfuromonadales bacterium]
MIRATFRLLVNLLILTLLPATLVLAAPVVHLDPATPILGNPLSIIITLDNEETGLAGLPDLGSFEPLAPPLHLGQEIRLVVLPMRPGAREIPPFPLQVGTARQIETAPLAVTVLEGIADDAAIAPFKRRPFPLVGSGPGGWILAGALLLILFGAGIALLWRCWHRPDFFKLPQAVQLAHLEARARHLPASAACTSLLDEIRKRRFAPLASNSDDIHRLHCQLLSLIAAGDE